MNPDDFWSPFEEEVENFDDVQQLIHDVFDKWGATNPSFAWRGHVDASWPLHSALYRRALWTAEGTTAPDERRLYRREGEILVEVHRWGLHMGERGRLSILAQLAMLQHYGSPTRLVDVTFNPFIGLWFAVEQKFQNGKPVNEDTDGRLFCIDVTARLINERGCYRAWEDATERPWPQSEEANGGEKPEEWRKQVLAWRPPHLDARIAAQNGGFIFGGVPMSTPQSPKSSDPSGGWWKTDEVRRATSLALRAHQLGPPAGGVTNNPVYTIRVKADAKQQIRERLESLFGYRHSTIYPDFTGFASFGTPDLRSRPSD